MSYLTGVIVAVLLLGGCGEGESTPAVAKKPDRSKDRAAIATAVHDYLDAYMHGRGAEACLSFTDALRRTNDKKARDAGAAGGCAEVMSGVGPGIVERAPAGKRQELIDRMLGSAIDVRFGGDDLALASVTIKGSQRASGKRIELTREQGEWRISRLSVLEGVPWP